MFKKITVLVVLCLSVVCNIATAEEAELPPINDQYNSVHGMVLFTKSSMVYAYNLSKYQLPNNVQLLYQLDIKDVALLQMIRDAQLVTIKPEAFNIQRLVRGEELTINADIYMGNYERDGMLVHKSRPLIFAKKLYSRYLNDLDESSNIQEYDVVDLNNNYKIYIHKIQQAPSYDHVLYIDVEASCLSRFNTRSPVPKRSELQYKFINCGTMTPLYFETQDFQ
ncbi:hypothetical protein [Thalassotalea profundi]|uniref:Uncharacterized protein n=1 Tax=Thalassotalea profundi TaxID=2036687 RepID=A0ABQ3IMB9_9GAMM|nr:hypothetical protein [Thalassotalea profundi]GHE85742.1 hypothetical protein GCM10011501_13560 [Thalassotalea profundi]